MPLHYAPSAGGSSRRGGTGDAQHLVEERGNAGLDLLEREPGRFVGIVAGDRLAREVAAGDRDEDEMKARPDDVNTVEGAQRLGPHAGFLGKLAHGGLRHRLARLDLAARKAPAPRIGRIGAPDEQETALVPDDGDGGGARDRFVHGRPFWYGRRAAVHNPVAGGVAGRVRIR
jgi:hypothetical protein